MKNNRTLILSGGTINTGLLKTVLEEERFQFTIAVDGGLEAADKAGLDVDYIVGDFDSVSRDTMAKYKDKAIIKQFPPEKNYTDTHLALELAIEIGGEDLLILGATGTRFDHMQANLHLLVYLLRKKIKAVILDENNRIYLIEEAMHIEKRKAYGPFLSLLPITEKVKGVTLKGFKYPLDKAELSIEGSIGISNEIIDETGTIELEEGILLVVETKDA